MSRLIFKRLAQLVVLSAGLLSTGMYVNAEEGEGGDGAKSACSGTWCNTQGTTVCCTNSCCTENGGYCN